MNFQYNQSIVNFIAECGAAQSALRAQDLFAAISDWGSPAWNVSDMLILTLTAPHVKIGGFVHVVNPAVGANFPTFIYTCFAQVTVYYFESTVIDFLTYFKDLEHYDVED